MSKNIETKVRQYDEGLSIIKEVTKIITHEDGTVETKVHTFEIGKRSQHSDYWRSHYASDEVSVSSDETREEALLKSCIYDVAKIANAFDSEVAIAYKTPENHANNPEKDVVLLDPDVALSEDKMGQKIDVYSGEILLGTALRKQNAETKASYAEHAQRAFDKEESDVKRAASMLYLAMEANAACEHIKDEAPGFTEYAHARARNYVSQEGSTELQDFFLEDDVDPAAKFAALIREFDTFGTQPLDYGEYGKVIDYIKEVVESQPDAKSRLQVAEQLAHRYLVEMNGKMELSDGSSSKPDMGMMEKMLSSCDLFGDDGSKEDGGKPSDCVSKFGKPKTPQELLKEKELGEESEVPVNFTTEVQTRHPHKAKRLYELDRAEVQQLSIAIEDSLQILNHQEKCWDEYSLRSGEIDEGSFHKLIDNSDNVFYRMETLPKIRLQVGILIDESGSMACFAQSDDGMKEDKALSSLAGDTILLSRASVARKLATAFQEGTKNIDGIDLFIYGHAGPAPECNIYSYTNPETTDSQFHRLAHITDRLHNYDGYAILGCGEDMLKRDDVYNRRIMFVLSDGEPSVSNYTGERAKKHTAAVVRHLNNCGVETYVIGVDNAFPDDDGEYMYGKDKFISLNNFNLNEVTNIISAFLEEISRSI